MQIVALLNKVFLPTVISFLNLMLFLNMHIHNNDQQHKSSCAVTTLIVTFDTGQRTNIFPLLLLVSSIKTFK